MNNCQRICIPAEEFDPRLHKVIKTFAAGGGQCAQECECGSSTSSDEVDTSSGTTNPSNTNPSDTGDTSDNGGGGPGGGDNGGGNNQNSSSSHGGTDTDNNGNPSDTSDNDNWPEDCDDEVAGIEANDITIVNPGNCSGICTYEFVDFAGQFGEQQIWKLIQNDCNLGCECPPPEELEPINLVGSGPYYRAAGCRTDLSKPTVTSDFNLFGPPLPAGGDPRSKVWTTDAGLTIRYNSGWINPANGTAEGRWEIIDPNSTENDGVIRSASHDIGQPGRDPKTIYPWDIPALGLSKICP